MSTKRISLVLVYRESILNVLSNARIKLMDHAIRTILEPKTRYFRDYQDFKMRKSILKPLPFATCLESNESPLKILTDAKIKFAQHHIQLILE